MDKILSWVGVIGGSVATLIPPITCTGATGSWIVTGVGAMLIAYAARRLGQRAD